MAVETDAIFKGGKLKERLEIRHEQDSLRL